MQQNVVLIYTTAVDLNAAEYNRSFGCTKFRFAFAERSRAVFTTPVYVQMPEGQSAQDWADLDSHTEWVTVAEFPNFSTEAPQNGFLTWNEYLESLD